MPGPLQKGKTITHPRTKGIPYHIGLHLKCPGTIGRPPILHNSDEGISHV